MSVFSKGSTYVLHTTGTYIFSNRDLRQQQHVMWTWTTMNIQNQIYGGGDDGGIYMKDMVTKYTRQ